MYRNKSLSYHSDFPAGKLQTMPSKPIDTLKELSLAYTPGAAAPCHAIKEDPNKVYAYTGKGNLVAVITNGTAVLSLGDIGVRAAKPVMESKAALLKTLAGLDAFDLEIDEKDPKKLVDIIAPIAHTFGGIILEDIEAPACFYLEKKLQEKVTIPVMHDDQHSTAIVIGAALTNALQVAKKDIKNLRTVIYGEGPDAFATAHLLSSMGLPKQKIIMFDSQGAVHKQRPTIPPSKAAFATSSPISLIEAMHGADFFLGLSVGNLLKTDHLRCMARNPIVFALSNPEPEIDYTLAQETRKDIILGTGRSDYPNQINNVLAFPYILRGLLDVQASHLNEAVKLAAVQAIASLVHNKRSPSKDSFSKQRLIPQPLDKRLLPTVATAVGKAAMKSNIAQNPIQHWDDYHRYLQQRMDYNHS